MVASRIGACAGSSLTECSSPARLALKLYCKSCHSRVMSTDKVRRRLNESDDQLLSNENRCDGRGRGEEIEDGEALLRPH